MQTIGTISQEWLKIEVKLLLSANKKSYMLRRLAQKRMTFSDLEWTFHASRAVSAVAEFFVYLLDVRLCRLRVLHSVLDTVHAKKA